MTVARELAGFLARTAAADLTAPAIDHAAMLIASTIASAAFGRGLESATIIRDLARERGGRPDAAVWFEDGREAAARRDGAGQRGDERRRRLRRQRSAQHRPLRHAA